MIFYICAVYSTMSNNTEPLFLGFDFSTQQIKVIALDNSLRSVYSNAASFDDDTQYGTRSGCHTNGLVVTAPTLMWVETLDVLLGRMSADNFPFHRVVAISGSAQQHGSVYWNQNASKILADLDPKQLMKPQLTNAFSIENSPIWMDASTAEYCEALESHVGGADVIAKVTGMRVFERCTAPQIMKIIKEQPERYKQTAHIGMVSSFGCSLLTGTLAAIDWADGVGTNLIDTERRIWHRAICDYISPTLRDKLPLLVEPASSAGTVSRYLSARYGFPPQCVVVAFTGDNPSSLAGLHASPTDVFVSLGTSDTVFMCTTGCADSPALLDTMGFVNPVDSTQTVSMLVYKNGSLARQRVRDSMCNGSWEEFNESLSKSPVGNNGNIGFYYYDMEVIPHVQGVWRFNKEAQKVSQFAPEVEVRALLESQFLSKRLFCERLGLDLLGPSKRIVATGGASVNLSILRVLADVMGTPVYGVEGSGNSAALGAAYRAKHVWSGSDFTVVMGDAPGFVLLVEPDVGNVEIYNKMLGVYEEREKTFWDK